MTDMTQQQLDAAIDQNWEAIADQVFDGQLEAQIQRAAHPADWRVSDDRLTAASLVAADALPANLRFAALAGSSRDWGAMASDGASATVNTDKVLEEADGEKREKAAGGLRDYLCGEARERIEAIMDQLKSWLEELGIKGTIKKLGDLGKKLVGAAVTAIAGVVGSTFAAYLLIGLAVAAVGAAIYFAVKKGLPSYCAV